MSNDLPSAVVSSSVLLLWCWTRGGFSGGLHFTDQYGRDRRGFAAAAVLVYLFEDGFYKDWFGALAHGHRRWHGALVVRTLELVLGALLLWRLAVGGLASWDSVVEAAEVAFGVRVSAQEPPVVAGLPHLLDLELLSCCLGT